MKVGVHTWKSFLWEGALALIWEVGRDEGGRFWGQTELNSYLTYKLWDFREGTYTFLYFFSTAA